MYNLYLNPTLQIPLTYQDKTQFCKYLVTRTFSGAAQERQHEFYLLTYAKCSQDKNLLIFNSTAQKVRGTVLWLPLLPCSPHQAHLDVMITAANQNCTLQTQARVFLLRNQLHLKCFLTQQCNRMGIFRTSSLISPLVTAKTSVLLVKLD